jgi:sterol 3beta-glucosyltransferase
MGFGSMVGRDPKDTLRLIGEAVKLSQHRAIVLTGWAGANVALPDSILSLDSAPHSWLFARVAAVVHHGGAGTTAAGLRAGKPTVIVPHLADQAFWGQRVAALSVGPPPIPRPKLTPESLAQAMVSATTNTALAQRAAALGAQIKAEDGIGVAVTLINRYLNA